MREHTVPRTRALLVGSAVLVAAVAYIDFVTGTELRVFPLYFLPILAVSLRLGYGPGLGTAALCAAAWELSNRLAGMRGSGSAVGLANLLVMGIAFGSIAVLGARQRVWLLRERAISRTDGLTGLLNGRGFYEAAATELARAGRYRHPLTLAYVDLDDFKEINDRFGHSRGDAEAALAKVRSRVEELGRPDGARVAASIGSVSFPAPPADVEVLVHEADSAMYAVKASGKGALRCVSYGENQ